MVQHALDRGYAIVAVCREQSARSSTPSKIASRSLRRDQRSPVNRARRFRMDGVLVVLVPCGVHHYASGTAQAVLDYAPPRHTSCSHADGISRATARTSTRGSSRRCVRSLGGLARLVPLRRPKRPVEACRRIFATGRPGPSCAAATWRKAKARGCPMEPTRRRPDLERRDAPGEFRPVHGGGAQKRSAHPPGPGDRRLPVALGARARRKAMNFGAPRRPRRTRCRHTRTIVSPGIRT